MQKYIAQANFAPNLTEQYYKSSKYTVLDDSSGDFGLFKVRAGEFRYDSSNVIVYEIEKTDGFVHFEFKEFSTEKEHLEERTEHDDKKQLQNINDLKAQGKSVREIASLLGLSKSKVWRLIQAQTTTVPECPTVPAPQDAGQLGHPGQQTEKP